MGAGDNRQAALVLAARGLSVFPCKGGEGESDDDAKRPLPNCFWRRESTTDARRIERWWNAYPRAIPALDLAKSKLIVIDCDRPKVDGADGVEWFAAWSEEHGLDLSAVPATTTLSGGRHLFFRNPDGLGNARGALPPKKACGVDVRGSGGYVIAPGASLPDGRAYVAEGDPSDAPEMPPELASLLCGESEKRVAGDVGKKPTMPPVKTVRDDARTASYVEAGVEAELRQVRSARKGERNNTLNTAAFSLGQMVGAGWIAEADAAAWLEAAAGDCGLVRDDGVRSVRATIRSGLRAGRQAPRSFPVEPENAGADIARSLIERDGSYFDPETGEEVRREAPVPSSFCFPASDFDGRGVPPRHWHVQDLIPAMTVTLLGGDGGTGKSLLALQLAAATALRRQWLGFDVSGGRALYLSAEDDVDELHRRLASIANVEGVGMADLDELLIAPMAGKDAVLAAASGKGGEVRATKLFERLERAVSEATPALVILDTLADLFAGEENNRMQARQFVQLLRGLAIRRETSIILLSHPSLSGISSGSGSSGSTAWSNSVRSRLYLTRVHVEDGNQIVEPDTDVRVLTSKKANYAQSGMEIRMRWADGVFVADERDEGVFAGSNRILMVEQRFLSLLRAYDLGGRIVSATPSANYAPTVFARDPQSNGIGRQAFEMAMNRLFEAGRLQVIEQGPISRRQRRIIEVEQE